MKTKYIALLAVGVIAASCQDKTLDDTKVGGVQKLEVSVSTQVLSRTPVIGKSYAHGSQINVILLDKATTTSYNVAIPYQLDRPNTAADGVWVPAGHNVPLEVKTDIASVLAHYPATEQITLSNDKQTITPTSAHTLDLGENNASALYESFQVTLDPTKPAITSEIFSAKADLDYMTGTGNDVSTLPGQTQATSITMKHAKAMVVVHLYKEDGYVGDDQLKSFTIANTAAGKKPLKEGTFKLSDNSFTPTNAITYRRTMSKFNGGTHFSMLAFPANITAGDVTMELHVAAIRYTLPMPAKTWEAGKVYLYNVELSANAVKLVGGVKAYDWPAVIKLPVILE